MALQGINLPLAFTGQEAIWQKVYLVIFFVSFIFPISPLLAVMNQSTVFFVLIMCYLSSSRNLT